MQRGQLTLFIIIGLIGLLVFVALQYTLTEVPVSDDFDARVDSVGDYVQSCLDESVEEALFLFGSSGGLIFPPLDPQLPNAPKQIVQFEDFGVATWQYDELNIMPDVAFLETYELSEYIENELATCTEFSAFLDIEVSAGEIEASSKIGEERVSFKVKYPLTIKANNREAFIEDFSARKDVRLGLMLSESAKLISSSKFTPGFADVTAMANSQFDVTVSQVEDTAMVYHITDSKSLVQGKPFNLFFAARWTE